jgi:hypothetical protein
MSDAVLVLRLAVGQSVTLGCVSAVGKRAGRVRRGGWFAVFHPPCIPGSDLMTRNLLAAAIAVTIAAGCTPTGPRALARIPGLDGATQVYTQTNLHPDHPRRILHATNYQRAGLIPACTRVTILSITLDDRWMKFRVDETGKIYTYRYHPASGERFVDNIARYFGTECPTQYIAKLSDVDRRGIELGVAEVGMSKRGVVYAIGYPPFKATRTLDARVWRYWRNRFASYAVEFDEKDRVSRVSWKRSEVER